MSENTIIKPRVRWLRYAVIAAVLLVLGGTVGLLAASGTLGRFLSRDQRAASDGQLWTCGMHPQVIQDHPGDCPICHMKLTPLKATGAAAKPSGQRKIKYWWDPMLGPKSISDKPGKSAMGMDLVPVYEDEQSAGPTVTIDPSVVQNMGVRVAQVTEGPLRGTVRAVGFLKEAEPNIHDINLRLSGWVEKLHANTEGMHVRKGDPLFELFSPQLQVAVEEIIAARRAVTSEPTDELASKSASALYEASERKLLLLGLDKDQVATLARLDHAPRTIPFISPVHGHVTEKAIVEGAALKEGERVLRIVDHSMLWLDAQIYESQLPFIKTGQKATATISSIPGKQFAGEVTFIHPHVDPATRTVMVRVVIPNEELILKPGMYATVLISSELADQVVLVPREAIIDTGTRQVAFIARPGGHFEPRKVKMGVAAEDGMVQVLEGLAPGETVVTSGQFLIDAESRMKEAIEKHLSQKMLATASQPPGGPATATAATPAVPGDEKLDALVRAYLELANFFGKAQKTDEAADVAALIAAAEQVAAGAVPAYKPLAEQVGKAARDLKDQPIAQQRKAFKPLSEATVALVSQVLPSKAVAQKLYVMHCPMADEDRGANWLQANEVLANPYFPTSMKRCGEVKKEIDLPANAAGHEHRTGTDERK